MANETYESLNKRLINIRRDLHEHPELSGEEYETTNKIRRWLEEEGITVLDMPKLQTGVIAEIKGDKSTRHRRQSGHRRIADRRENKPSVCFTQQRRDARLRP